MIRNQQTRTNAKMNKQLLTALLFAGLSATATAEPVVYYCNTTAYAQVKEEKVQNIRSYAFRLFIDRENKKIKIAGEVNTNEVEEGVYSGAVSINADSSSFMAWDNSSLLNFENGRLLQTVLSRTASIIQSYSAQCDRY